MQLASLLNVKQSVVITTAVVALSAVAHGVILWLPMPEVHPPSSPTAAEPEPEDMSVVVLSRPASRQEPPPAPASQPSRSPSPKPAPAITPPPALEPTLLPTDVIPESSSAPAPRPSQPKAPAPAIPDELPIADGEATPAFPSPASAGPLIEYGDRFPHFDGAVGGCFGLSECRQVSDIGNYRTVARSLISGLEDQGYTVELRDDLEDTGRNVYELTPPGNGSTRQFLLVFSNTDGSAIYVMSPDVMTLDELKSLSAQGGGDRSPV